MVAEWLFCEISAVPVVLVQLVILVPAARLLWNLSRFSKSLMTDLDDVGKAMEKIPSLTAATLWYPKNVAVIASVYKISPEEVNKEYQKDGDAKKKIVNSTFPTNRLTDKLAYGLDGTRFVNSGYDYDYNDTLPASRASSRASNGSTVEQSPSNQEQSSDTKQSKKSEAGQSSSTGPKSAGK